MPKTKVVNPPNIKKLKPAMSEEAREAQMIKYAMDLVEQRLLDGTATSQETTFFLKLGSSKEKYELEKLKLETELVKAKTEALRAERHADDATKAAIEAFKRYSPSSDYDDEDEEYDDYDY